MKRASIALFRALRLRCPFCGGGPLFSSWFTMGEVCPRCGLRLEREEGYFTGAIAMNLVVAEGVFLAVLVLTLVLTWPNPPWNLLQWGSIALMILTPLAFYPFSKTVWLALDLTFRPPAPNELTRPNAPAADANGRAPKP